MHVGLLMFAHAKYCGVFDWYRPIVENVRFVHLFELDLLSCLPRNIDVNDMMNIDEFVYVRLISHFLSNCFARKYLFHDVDMKLPITSLLQNSMNRFDNKMFTSFRRAFRRKKAKFEKCEIWVKYADKKYLCRGNMWLLRNSFQ